LWYARLAPTDATAAAAVAVLFAASLASMLHAVALNILNCCCGLKATVELWVAGMNQRFRNRRVDGQEVEL
jgi:hypothetical protein